MKKKATAMFLTLVMLISMLINAVPTYAADTFLFTITADKTEAYPGDTITYTVTMGAVENFQSANFTLVIPEGLTFVDGEVPEGLKELTGATEAGFEDSTLTFYHGGLESYTSDKDTILMTFTCTVGEELGAYDEVTIMDDYDFADTNWTTYENIVIDTSASKVTVVQKPIPATGVTLNKSEVALKEGVSEILTATVAPENTTDTLKWFSSDENIATVDMNGKVTAIAKGTATITVEVGSVSATCQIIVECAHRHTTEYPAVESTCTEQGNGAYITCDDCNTIIEGSDAKLPLDSENHVNTETHETEIGDCVTPGHGEYTYCNDCKTIISGSDSPVIGPHGPYVEKAEEKYLKSAADCVNAAVYYKSCSLCGEAHETETFTYGEALGHDWSDATCTTAKTCKVCKVTEGEALGHSFTVYVSNQDADCVSDGTKTAKCDRCEVKDTVTDKGSALGHDWSDATCTEAKTCKRCKVTEGTALGHSYSETWSTGNDGHWHECTVCGDRTDEGKHDFGTAGDNCLVCNYERGHVHRLTLVPAVAATCTEAGNKAYYTCSGCEDWFEDATGTVVIADKTSVNIKALGHDMSDATCTEAPVCQRENCTYTEGTALGHSFTNYVSNNDATCLEDGTKTAKCDRCEKTDTVADEESALGHSFTNYVSNNDATCLEDGTKTAECDRCDEKDTMTDKGSALGHDWSDATCLEAKTCQRCKETEGEALGHSFINYVSNNDATCLEDGTKTAICDRCDEKDTVADKGSALGHNWTEATCSNAKTCERCHTTEGKALGHSFTNYVANNNATCLQNGTKTAKCDRCDVTDSMIDEGTALGHDWIDATCTEAKTCNRCKFVEGAALGHSFTDYVSNDDASCVEDGTKTAKCDRCDVTDTAADEGSALGHDYAKEWSKGENDHWHECLVCGEKTDVSAHDYGTAGDNCIICNHERDHVHRLTLTHGNDATCLESGNKAYYTCSGCEDWFEDAEGKVIIADKTSVELKALGHSFTDYVSNNDADCENDGTKTAKCDRCDVKDTITDEGSAFGHNWTEATCTESKICKVCQKTEGSALGHSFTDYVSNNDATCENDGTKTAKCDRCELTDTVTDEGSALGHNWLEATCTEAKTCERCKATEGEALGHNWLEATCMEAKTCDRCQTTEGEALGHSFTNYISNNDATYTEDGTKTAVCDRCEATDTVTDEGSKKKLDEDGQITDSAAGGIILEGDFADGAEVVVTEEDENSETYKTLMEYVEEGYTLLQVMDIEVLKEIVSEKVTVTIPVGTEYNTRNAIVYHMLENGTVEEFAVVVENGKVSVTVDSFSPFAVAIEDVEDNTDDITSTGDIDHFVLWTSMLAVSCMAAMFGISLKKKNRV